MIPEVEDPTRKRQRLIDHPVVSPVAGRQKRLDLRGMVVEKIVRAGETAPAFDQIRQAGAGQEHGGLRAMAHHLGRPMERLRIGPELLALDEFGRDAQILHGLDGELLDPVVHAPVVLPYVPVHGGEFAGGYANPAHRVARMLFLDAHDLLAGFEAFDPGGGRVPDGTAEVVVDLQIAHALEAFGHRPVRHVMPDPGLQTRLPEHRVGRTFEDREVQFLSCHVEHPFT